MRIITRASTLFLAGSFFAVQVQAGSLSAEDPWKNYDKVKNALPKDAAVTLERAVDCYHLSGEFDGDQSDADKAVTKQMEQLKCDTVDENILEIKKKYKSDAAVQRAFKIYLEAE